MSGFVGCVRTDGASVSRDLMAQLTGAMAFRGPDALAAWCEGPIGLGMAVLHTTREATNDDGPATLNGKQWVVGDIRLAGRKQLVKKLEDTGISITENASDAALILHAYAAWGEQCVEHLLGDFAFVLWDGERRKLFGARDHFGIAQFCYMQTSTALLAGNTLQSLLFAAEMPVELNEQALSDFACFGFFLDDDATVYAAVRRLPPGHCLAWGADGLRVTRYWAPEPKPQIYHYRRSADYVDHFRDLLMLSVADCVRSDRAGVLLSGGLDSASIAVILRDLLERNHPGSVHAFTVAGEGHFSPDASAYVVQIAQAAALDHEFVGEGEIPSEPAWLPPEPGAAALPGWNTAVKQAAASSRVLLAGFGGDPLQSTPSVAPGNTNSGLRGLLRRMRGPQQQALPAWLNPELVGTQDLQQRQTMLAARQPRGAPGMVTDPIWRAVFAWTDPGHTGQPLVVRAPFFDRRLFDLIRHVPALPWLENKCLLRAALQGRLPDAVATQPDAPLLPNRLPEVFAWSVTPVWATAALAEPAMARYIAPGWLASITQMPPEIRAGELASARTLIELAYWLQHRRAPAAPARIPVVEFRRANATP